MENSNQWSRLPKFMQQLFRGNWKRLLIVFLLLIFIVFIFILFPQPVTLSFVVPWDEAESWKPLIEQFQSKNKGIRIDLANLRNSGNALNPKGTDELKGIYVKEFKSKSQAFDLIYTDIIWVPEFAEEGWLMDLTREFSLDKLEKEFIKSEVDDGKYNDKLYRIPFRTDVGVLYYRKDLVKSPPETFDDLIKISQALQEQKKVRWGYFWQGQHSEALAAMFVEVLEGYGGFWIKDKTVGLAEPEARKAVEFLRDTIKQGISPSNITAYNEADTRNRFIAGEAVFMRNWPSVWTDANKPGSFVRGKIAIRPMVNAGNGQKRVACKGGWGFGIAEKSKHKEEALEAIKFFTSAAFQREFTLKFTSVPSRRKLFFEPKIVAKYSHYPQLLNIIDQRSITRPRIPRYADASKILQRHLTLALDPNNKEYQQAMEEAAEETRNLLKDS